MVKNNAPTCPPGNALFSLRIAREVGFRGIDRRARPHRDEQERVAARDLFDRQAGRIDRRGIEADRRG